MMISPAGQPIGQGGQAARRGQLGDDLGPRSTGKACENNRLQLAPMQFCSVLFLSLSVLAVVLRPAKQKAEQKRRMGVASRCRPGRGRTGGNNYIRSGGGGGGSEREQEWRMQKYGRARRPVEWPHSLKLRPNWGLWRFVRARTLRSSAGRAGKKGAAMSLARHQLAGRPAGWPVGRASKRASEWASGQRAPPPPAPKRPEKRRRRHTAKGPTRPAVVFTCWRQPRAQRGHKAARDNKVQGRKTSNNKQWPASQPVGGSGGQLCAHITNSNISSS